MRLGLLATGLSVAVLLGLFVVFPQLDLWSSGLFAEGQNGFVLQGAPPLVALNFLAFNGARVLGVLFLAGALIAWFKKRAVAGLSAKAWAFLFLALLIGPGLVANVVFKDHWGRARPREIVAFGGHSTFTPPLVLSDQCDSNCSFVSGDGAFGFFLPTIAYVVPRRKRRAFRGLMALGAVFGGARILMGAHFLSDVLFAAVFMLLVSAGLHVLFFGARATKACWNEWLGQSKS